MTIRIILILSTIFLLSSCSLLNMGSKNNVNLSYLPKSFEADYQSFFNGEIDGFSIVKDHKGNIINARKVSANGSWEGNKGIIRQKYTDISGNKSSRTWLVTLNKDGSFTAIGHDALSSAKGVSIGNMTHIGYYLSLDLRENKNPTSYNENMYLIDEDSMIMVTEFNSENGEKGTEITSLKRRIKDNSQTEN